MDIVDKVAIEIAEIPGNPTAREIARIAIEAYQQALWKPTFDRRMVYPELRRARTQILVAQIMAIVSKQFCDHGDRHGPRDASADLFETFYEVGAEVITDMDRTIAGLPPRGPYGLSPPELAILEQHRLNIMRSPVVPAIGRGL